MNVKDSLTIIKKYWNTAPVDVFAIARELGVPVLRATLPQNISGMIRQDGSGYMIVVNGTHALTRQRFTVAHELGHYIYHRDLLGKGVGDTRAYRAEGTELPNPNITITHERQANTFAANLLMPNHLIASLKAAGTTTPEALARALGVSVEAMKIKLGIARERPAAPDDEEIETEWAPPNFR